MLLTVLTDARTPKAFASSTESWPSSRRSFLFKTALHSPAAARQGWNETLHPSDFLRGSVDMANHEDEGTKEP